MTFYITFSVVFINGDGILLKAGPFNILPNEDKINFPIIENIIKQEMRKISRQGVYSTSSNHLGIKHYSPQQVFLISVDKLEYDTPAVEAKENQIENIT